KQCPNCWSEINLDVNHFTDEILVEIKKERVGKSFSISDQNLPTNLNSIEQRLLGELSYLSEDFIDIPKWSGITNLTIYGLTEYINFLNQRQRIIVLLLLKSLHKEFELIKEEKGEPMAKVVIGLLSGLVDQLVDWNSRITMWISQNQQVGRSLSGPGIPMYWDYVEIDPLSTGPANLWDKLDRILNGAAQIPENQAIIEIHQGIAQELPFKSDFFDAVITDPPYYDNLNYSLLADFIYFWKRGLISQLLGRDINKTTRIHQELVASKNIHGSLAHEWFSNGFMKAIKEIERTIKPDGIFSLIYSHKTVMAWDALCFAYQNSNFYIYQVQPLGIERKARPRGMMAKAVNSCLVLIGKKQTQKKFPIPENFIENLVIDHNFVLSLRNNGWDEFDIGLGLFGKCIQQLVQYTPYPVVENRINLITQIVNKINEIVPSFNLDTRTSI
ncbi:MAG: hypothetical protein OEY49_16580, partial [Candidatus Heimdallarchaeota archaeon]|nr:hypothetical protein [Candidatus Heimdallarchaeota archaeon]